MVLKNGEIVETGTHDELIHLKGKYNDLWSKQVDVKPASDRSRSKSPRKRDKNIINDLSPEQKTTELTKVLRTTEHSEVSSLNTEVRANKNEIIASMRGRLQMLTIQSLPN
jgi:ABC-type multidrug transport system ATPase subunit